MGSRKIIALVAITLAVMVRACRFPSIICCILCPHQPVQTFLASSFPEFGKMVAGQAEMILDIFFPVIYVFPR
jgi:hypothetical protein